MGPALPCIPAPFLLACAVAGSAALALHCSARQPLAGPLEGCLAPSSGQGARLVLPACQSLDSSCQKCFDTQTEGRWPWPALPAEYIPRLRHFLVECWGEEYRQHLRAGGISV